jgi:hypothetical protein
VANEQREGRIGSGPGPTPAHLTGAAGTAPLAQHRGHGPAPAMASPGVLASDHDQRSALRASWAAAWRRATASRTRQSTARAPRGDPVTDEVRAAVAGHGAVDLEPLGRQPPRQLQAPDNAWLTGSNDSVNHVSHTHNGAPDNPGFGAPYRLLGSLARDCCVGPCATRFGPCEGSNSGPRSAQPAQHVRPRHAVLVAAGEVPRRAHTGGDRWLTT